MEQTYNDQCTKIVSAKLKPDDAEKLKEACAKLMDSTPYNFIQLCCLALIARFDDVRNGRESRTSLTDFMQQFCFDQESAVQALTELRSIFAYQKLPSEHPGIEYAILVHKGGVVEVYDPHDEDGFAGTVKVNEEKALEILLSRGRKHLPDMFTNVMAERGTRSILNAIYTLFREENEYLHQVDDDMLNYASNEYGNVPKQIRTRTIK